MRPALVLFLVLAGCESGDSDTDVKQTQEEDLAEFDAKVAELEEYRADFLSESADQLTGYGSHLFWLNYHSSWNPTVYVWTGSGSNGTAIVELNGDNVNFRASESMVVTAIPEGNKVRYSSYKIDATHMGDLVVDAPPTEAKWWAYAADGQTAYLVEDNTPDATLKKWTGGASSTTDVTTFSSMGATISEFWDFDIEDKTMIFIESGRIWKADLQANSAQWLENETQVSGAVNYTQDDALYATSTGLIFFDFATGTTRNISEEIKAASYKFNETFSNIHHPGGNGAFTRLGSKVVYEGARGIFAFDLDNGDVRPILLEPNTVPSAENPRISYRDPVLLPGGILFVTGLESASGSVGADGPVYRVDHPFLQ